MKKNFLFGFLMVFAICCFVGCPHPPSPPPPPIEPVYFHIQIKYTRPAGSVFFPEQLRKGASAILEKLYFDFDERTDDYHFVWSEPQVMQDNENDALYWMYGCDPARCDGILFSDKGIVGDIFFIRVQETGFEIQLTNIRQNNVPVCPYKGPNAKMVLWRLNRNGTVANN